MKVYLAADHGGYQRKQQLMSYLQKKGYEIVDCGAFLLNDNDDYPDFIKELARKMQADSEVLGIVVCRNGVGVSIAANRYSHLRCGLGLSEAHVKSARVDDNINVLALPADYFDLLFSQKLVDTFLNTPFSNLDRHLRRLAKVENLGK